MTETDTGGVPPRAPSAVVFDYLFLALGAALGAIVGGLQDAFVSFPLSPEYFTIGKELPEGDGLHLRATLLGLQAGFGPGLLAAAVLLYAGRGLRVQPPVPRSRLARLFLLPLLTALACSALAGTLLAELDPLQFGMVLEPLIERGKIAGFLRVWWLHVGLYGGFALGLVLAAVRVARACRVHRPRPLTPPRGFPTPPSCGTASTG